MGNNYQSNSTAHSFLVAHRIFSIIILHHNISNQQLIRLTNIDRGIIREATNNLQKEGLIYITRKTGGERFYKATSKALDEVYLFPKLLGNQFFKKIIYQKLNKKYYSNLSLDRFKGDTKVSILYEILGHLSRKIGAYITICFILAMTHKTIEKITNNKISKINDVLIEEWIRNTIPTTHLLKEFRKEIIKSGNYRKEVPTNEIEIITKNASLKKIRQELEKKSKYELPEEIIYKLHEAMKILFPDIYNELTKLEIYSQESLDKDKKYFEQTTCDHKFNKTTKGKEIYFICKICDLEKVIPKTKIINDIKVISKLNDLVHKKYIITNEDLQKKVVNYNVFRCNENDHIWQKNTVSKGLSDKDILFTEYQCVLCKILVQSDVVKRAILKKMSDEVKEQINSDKYTLMLYNIIKYFIYINSSSNIQIQDIIEHVEQSGLRNNILNNINKILDIMVNCNYIEKYYSNDIKHNLFYIRKSKPAE